MSKANGNFVWKDSVDLKEYFEVILRELRVDCNEKVESLEDKINQRFNLKDQALDTANRSMDSRLEGMNEFRASLSDASKTFMTRDIYEAKHDLIQKQVDDLRMLAAENKGKASQTSVIIAYIISFIGIIMGMIDYLR